MDEQTLISVLEDAGLSPYQADAYVALLELGSASATDLADVSQVPDPRIYDVLRDLETKGFIETYKQDSLHARAHDPGDVLEDLRTRATQFEAAASEIEERWTKPEMDQSRVSIVSRFATVIESAERYIRQAENRVQLSVTPKQFQRLRPSLVEAIDRGVLIKLSLHTEDGEPPGIEAEALDGACTEARHRPLPSPFVVIVDRERACFAPHTDSINQYGVLVEDRSHTYVFHWFFLTSLWDVWEVIYTARETDPATAYVDIRYFIRDVKPLFDEGASVDVEITGTDTKTGAARTIQGRLVDVRTTSQLEHSTHKTQETGSIAEYAGVAAVTVDTADGRVSVGGWGATVEDLEAERITVTGFTE